MRLSTCKYFEVPTQVAFRDDDCDPDGKEGSRWLSGIAYRDEIICGCCGGIYEVEEVHDVIELEWENISEEECICPYEYFDYLDEFMIENGAV